VLFAGEHDLTRLDEAAIARLGVGRKFQKPTVFETHTVADNLLLALKPANAACSPSSSPARPAPSARASTSCSI
jgi:ABC-type uncharacterized transport system ATPase subunit